MRELDTSALLSVMPALGIGNPATATRQVLFDDENLQQVFDATKFARLPKLTAVLLESFNPGASSVSRQTITRSALFARNEYDEILDELGLRVGNADVYCVGVQVAGDASDVSNVTNFSAGVRPDAPEVTAGNPTIIAQGDSFDITANALVSGGNASGQNDIELEDFLGMMPMKLGGQGIGGADPDVLFMMAACDAGGGCLMQFQWKVHFCLKDMPIWYQLA